MPDARLRAAIPTRMDQMMTVAWRLPLMRSHGFALSGVLLIGAYAAVLLTAVDGLGPRQAWTVTAALVAVAAAMRPADWRGTDSRRTPGRAAEIDSNTGRQDSHAAT